MMVVVIERGEKWSHDLYMSYKYPGTKGEREMVLVVHDVTLAKLLLIQSPLFL